MVTLARRINELKKKEEEHRKSPSALSRMEIDNLNSTIAIEEHKIRADLKKQGLSVDKINEEQRMLSFLCTSIS